MTYQVQVGDRTLTVVRENDQFTIDGRPVEVHVASLGPHSYTVLLDGRPHVITAEPGDGGTFRMTQQGMVTNVTVRDELALLLEELGMDAGAGGADLDLKAPMPGLVLSVPVEAGQAVDPGDALVVLEAMKMENELRATASGTVKAVHARPGDAVGKGDLLVEFE